MPTWWRAAETLRADMDAPKVDLHLEQTMQLAQVLGINGTPAFGEFQLQFTAPDGSLNTSSTLSVDATAADVQARRNRLRERPRCPKFPRPPLPLNELPIAADGEMARLDSQVPVLWQVPTAVLKRQALEM